MKKIGFCSLQPGIPRALAYKSSQIWVENLWLALMWEAVLQCNEGTWKVLFCFLKGYRSWWF